MNKEVLKAYLKFYTGIIFVILIAAILYGIYNNLELPVILCVIDVAVAWTVCLILSLMAGRYTRIVKQQITDREADELKKYLREKNFAEVRENEFRWMKTPAFLLKNVKAEIREEEGKLVAEVPQFLLDNFRKPH